MHHFVFDSSWQFGWLGKENPTLIKLFAFLKRPMKSRPKAIDVVRNKPDLCVFGLLLHILYPQGYRGSKGSLPLALGEPPEASSFGVFFFPRAVRTTSLKFALPAMAV